jgi:hypothetical protein
MYVLSGTFCMHKNSGQTAPIKSSACGSSACDPVVGESGGEVFWQANMSSLFAHTCICTCTRHTSRPTHSQQEVLRVHMELLEGRHHRKTLAMPADPMDGWKGKKKRFFEILQLPGEKFSRWGWEQGVVDVMNMCLEVYNVRVRTSMNMRKIGKGNRSVKRSVKCTHDSEEKKNCTDERRVYSYIVEYACITKRVLYNRWAWTYA